ncbi:Dullard family phosphatase domain-containing protein [Toxoplasma gondii FOU]|uniref:Dullard family phosphatase domain-containing protein n=1 Tax=Toxoplasma gondii FOU TaxID=943167 RepID=A0A086L4B4_TOXGO|nr:Dullard family phosphatase domain-containing protein [Toxoplasma gondii FOU]
MPVSSLACVLGEEGPAAQTARLLLCLLGFGLLFRFSLHRRLAATLASLLHPRPRHYVRAHLSGCSALRPSPSVQAKSSFSLLQRDGASALARLFNFFAGSPAKRRLRPRRSDARRGHLPMTLVIDLDETLVLATKSRLCPGQLAVDVLIQGKLSTFYVAKRPFADVFLAEVCPPALSLYLLEPSKHNFPRPFSARTFSDSSPLSHFLLPLRFFFFLTLFFLQFSSSL